MGTHADVADHTAVFQFHHIIHVIGMLNLLPLLLGVDVVNHAEVDVVCLQPFQQILKCRTDIFHISGTVILTVF